MLTSLLMAACAFGAFQSPEPFPIGVWLQSPANAARYKQIGINRYVGLWQGPTEAQIKALEAADMPVICEMNGWARENLGREIVVAWMHGDEPDNAQPAAGGGYGPPIPPGEIVKSYQELKRLDPSRPVLLNLGQGVAWDGWYGRGERTGKAEDYPEYVLGADIVSFDIYPVTHDHADVRGKLELVGFGTERLRRWAGDRRPVWACIEATRISNPNVLPTPEQTRSIVWMAIVHGATGLIYFSHQFEPSFIEAGILADPAMSEGIRRTNAEVQRWAPTLLRGEPVPVRTQGAVKALGRRTADRITLFAVSTTAVASTAEFALDGSDATVATSEEGTRLEVEQGVLTDTLPGYGVRIYTLTTR